MKYTCDDPAYPFLSYHYDTAKELKCVCKEHPCPVVGCITPTPPHLKVRMEGP